MLAQRTSAVTEGARRTKRSSCATTKINKRSPPMRKTPGGTRSGRKWLTHLAASVGIASKIATTSVRRLSATASTAESSTRESKNDTIRSPPLISSRKGAQVKKMPRAMSNCATEKRRRPNSWAAGFRNSTSRAVLLVSVSTISLSHWVSDCGHHFDLTNTI